MLEAQKAELKDIESKSVNVILDIWSTRMQESVLGVQVQYAKDWKVKLLTLGFLSFPEVHTGVNLKRKVEEHLALFGISIDEVSSSRLILPFRNGR